MSSPGPEVAATGRLYHGSDGLRLCPLPAGAGCPGLAVTGLPADNAPGRPDVVRLVGRIEAGRLVVRQRGMPTGLAARAVANVAAAEGPEPVCGVGRPTTTDAEEFDRYLGASSTYGGRWWDNERSALMVAFAAGASAELPALRERVAGPVCVVAVAHSVAELRQVSAKVTASTAAWVAAGYVVGGVGVDVPANRVTVAIAAVDPALRRELDRRFGDLVVASSFLELANDAVSALTAGVADPQTATDTTGELSAALAYHCRLALAAPGSGLATTG